jgi:hypothetical protein
MAKFHHEGTKVTKRKPNDIDGSHPVDFVSFASSWFIMKQGERDHEPQRDSA